MKATAEELKALMLQIGMERSLVDGLDPALPLAKQGVDSVDCPSFALAIEKAYGIRISDSDAMRIRTINDFVALINR